MGQNKHAAGNANVLLLSPSSSQKGPAETIPRLPHGAAFAAFAADTLRAIFSPRASFVPLANGSQKIGARVETGSSCQRRFG